MSEERETLVQQMQRAVEVNRAAYAEALRKWHAAQVQGTKP